MKKIDILGNSSKFHKVKRICSHKILLYTRFFRKQPDYCNLSRYIYQIIIFPLQISDPNNKLFNQKTIFEEFACENKFPQNLSI